MEKAETTKCLGLIMVSLTDHNVFLHTVLSLELINDHWYLIDSDGETHKNLVCERDSDAVVYLWLVSAMVSH